MAGNSTEATLIGLPVWLASRAVSSSVFSSTMSASLRRAVIRSAGVAFCHDSNALAAASTARSTSSGPDAGTRATISSLAGFSTSSVSPLALSTHWPPMNC